MSSFIIVMIVGAVVFVGVIHFNSVHFFRFLHTV